MSYDKTAYTYIYTNTIANPITLFVAYGRGGGGFKISNLKHLHHAEFPKALALAVWFAWTVIVAATAIPSIQPVNETYSFVHSTLFYGYKNLF